MNKSLLAFAMAVAVMFSACKKELTIQSSSLQSTTSAKTLVAKNGPLSAVYVEVNNNNILNAGSYTLKTGGQQLFDVAIIFAANINYDVTNKRAIEYNNENVTLTLQNKNTLIKPLQDKDIKVLLSILGNHQGAGISNFTSRTAAHDFAKQLADTVHYYDLDGVDFDDEYADYGNNGTTQPNDSSFIMLLQECKSLMPDKLLTLYYYGPVTSRLTYKGLQAGSYLNYSWNAYYGSFIVPNVPGLTKSQLSPAAVWINNTSAATSKNLATQTINKGYGSYLYYDLPGTDVHNYLSQSSSILYSDSVVLSSQLYPWPIVVKDTTGAVFFADINYGGAKTQPIPKGTYPLNKLLRYGFVNNWASSVQLPAGWKIGMADGNKGEGTRWKLSNDTPDFTQLVPNANDKVGSVVIY